MDVLINIHYYTNSDDCYNYRYPEEDRDVCAGCARRVDAAKLIFHDIKTSYTVYLPVDLISYLCTSSMD